MCAGFGSFVEKNVPPFTSPIQGFNCAKENPHCAPPYSFFHQQQLGNITANQFSKVPAMDGYKGCQRSWRESQ